MIRASSLAALAGLGVVAWFVLDGSPVELSAAATILLLVISAFVARGEYRTLGSATILSPVGLLLANCVLFYGVGAIDLAEHESYPAAVGPQDLPRALLSAIFGLSAVAVGLTIGSRRRNARHSKDLLRAPQISAYHGFALAALIVAGNIGQLLFFHAFGGLWSSPLRHGLTDGSANLGIYYALSLQLNLAAAFGLAYWPHSRAARGAAIASLACLTGYGLLSGGRSPLVGVAILTSAAIAARNRTTSLARMAGQALVVLAVMYLATLWRFSHHENTGIESLALRDNTLPYISESTGTYVAVLRSVPASLEFQNGKTFATAFVGMIPGALWPDKRAYTVLADQIVADEILDKRGQTLMPPTLFGEMYLNFGYLGIGAGALLIGVVVASLQTCFRCGPSRPRDLALAAALSPEICLMVRGPFSNHAISMVILLGGWYLASRTMEVSTHG